MRVLLATGFLSVFVGCGSSGVEGTLIDAMTDQPIPDMRLVAQAVDTVGMTCQTAVGTSDAQGKFKIDGACISESAYKVGADDKNLWFAEMPVFEKGLSGAVTLKAWRAGEGSGVFELSEGAVGRLGTGSDVKARKVFGTDVDVLRPKEVPGVVPLIAEGEFVIISGQENVESLNFRPLIPSGPRKFGNADEWIEAEAWWYVGKEFKTDTEYTEKTVTLDATKVLTKKNADRVVSFVPHDALPPGRYALMKDGARRMYIVDFVAAPELPGAETADGGK